MTGIFDLPNDALLCILHVTVDTRAISLTCTWIYSVYKTTVDSTIWAELAVHGIGALPVVARIVPAKLYSICTPFALYSAGNLPALQRAYYQSLVPRFMFVQQMFYKHIYDIDDYPHIAEWLDTKFSDILLEKYVHDVVHHGQSHLLRRLLARKFVHFSPEQYPFSFATFRVIFESDPVRYMSDIENHRSQISLRSCTLTYLSLFGVDVLKARDPRAEYCGSIDYIRAVSINLIRTYLRELRACKCSLEVVEYLDWIDQLG